MKEEKHLTRAALHKQEERLKHALRDQIAEAAGLVEVAVSLIVLLAVLFSAISVLREMVSLLHSDGTEDFQVFLGHAFNLVIGVEFIKMLAKHSPGSALEVLLYAIARHMILEHSSALANLLSVAAIGLIFIIRKFWFVPAFGSTLPSGQPAPDVPPAVAEDPESTFS